MLRSFIYSDSGAVTVDWVVLTAALVGLGLATMAVVSSGIQDTSSDIQGAMLQDNIIRTSFSGISGALDPYEASEVRNLQDHAKTLTNDDLSGTYASYLPFIDPNYSAWRAGIADGTYTEGTGENAGYFVDSGGNQAFESMAYYGSHENNTVTLIYGDEAAQRGLSWNETEQAFE